MQNRCIVLGKNLGPFADRMRKRSECYTNASALISVLTGTSVWIVLANSNALPALILVSYIALLSAAMSIVPKIRGYMKCAEEAAMLSSKYRNVLGELTYALEMLKNNSPNAQDFAAKSVGKFETVKTRKDALKPSPPPRL